MRRGASRTFASLRIRNFRLYLTGQLISQAGTWMTRIAQTLIVLDVSDGSGRAVSLLAVCQYLPVVLIAAAAGTVVDRVDKRRLLIVVQAGAMAQSAATAAVVGLGAASVGSICALAAVQGVLSAFDMPARRAFVTEMVPETAVANAVSLNSAALTSSRVFGPALAGVIVVTLGYTWCFAIDALSYVAVLAAFGLMQPAQLRRPPRLPRARGQVREGLRLVLDRRELRVPFVMLAIIGTLAFNLPITVPLLVTGPLGGTDLEFSVLFSVLSVGSVLGALFSARRESIGRRHLVGSALAFGVSMAALAAAPGLGSAFVVAAFLGLSSIAFTTMTSSAIQLVLDPAVRGRVLALQTTVWTGTTPLGGPILGLLADAAGARVAVAVGAVACVVAALYAQRRLPDVARPPIPVPVGGG